MGTLGCKYILYGSIWLHGAFGTYVKLLACKPRQQVDKSRRKRW